MTKYNLTLTLAEGQFEEKSMLLKGLTVMLVWAKYKSGILNTSAVTKNFQNLNAELEHGFKW